MGVARGQGGLDHLDFEICLAIIFLAENVFFLSFK